MLRICLALALALAADCLRQAGPVGEKRPAKKAFGPTQRRCRNRKEKSNHSNAVIGGTVVEDPNEFPFLAWLGDNDGTPYAQYCGGSLISDRIVLTAGHCLYDEDASNAKLWVRFQLTDFAVMPGVTRNIVNWVRHPDYDRVELLNDVTLLLLNESVKISPVKLSDGSRAFEQIGPKTLAGWGSTDEECNQYDTLLRKSVIPQGSPGPVCRSPGSKAVSASDDYDPSSQLCAGDYAGDSHYPGCGDSGGPLLADDGTSWQQVGLVSWSFGFPYPDVFTRVSHFRDWIAESSAELLKAGENPAIAEFGPRRA